MRIPINMGVKGRVTATLTNTETGEKQEVKGNNLILNHYLDWAMERGLGVLGDVTFNRCYIGNGDTPPAAGDTTFNGTQLAMSAVSELVKSTQQRNSFLSHVKTIEGLEVGTINALSLSPDNTLLAVARDKDRSPGVLGIEVYQVSWDDGFTLTSLDSPAFQYTKNDGISYQGIKLGDNQLFVGSGASSSIKVFNREGDTFSAGFDVDPGIHSNMRVNQIDISPNGRFIGVAAKNNTSPNAIASALLSFDSGGNLSLVQNFANREGFVKFSPTGKFFITKKETNYLELYEYDSSTDEYKLKFVSDPVGGTYSSSYCDVTFIGDNSFFVAGGLYSSGPGITYSRLFYMVIGEDDIELKSSISAPRPETSFRHSLESFSDSSFGPLILSGGHYTGIYTNLSGRLATPNTEIDYYFPASVAVNKNRGNFLARISDGSLAVYEKLGDIIAHQQYSRQWTFPAGTGTGIVNRIGLQANSGTGANGNNRHVAQIVLPEPLEKTDLHQLDVTWEIEVENPGVWEGVIPGGSRDGSDLAWRVTINEEQFYDLVQTGYRIPANWFGTTGTPNVRIGTSNEESDLIFDRENIRGEEIEYISSTAIREINPYTPGSLKRTIRLFLEVNQGNGQIGEMVLGGSTSANSLARITFDPPLDKPPDVGEGANPYRIYLDLEIGWQRGE